MNKRILKIFLLFLIAGLSFTILPEIVPQLKEVVPTLTKSSKKEVPLNTYIGTYTFNETIEAKITLKEDKLFIVQEELVKGPLAELKPISNTKFKVEFENLVAEIEFKIDKEKNTIDLIYVRDGQQMFAYKKD